MSGDDKRLSRADHLMPYAERYISLVIERKWYGKRMHARDLSKLDSDIETALEDYEAAAAREARLEAEAPVRNQRPVQPPPRRTHALTRASGRARPAADHPWNQRAVMPKK